MTNISLEIDHLLLAAHNLQDGINAVSDKLNVTASPGGKHPNQGTENALLGLQGQKYLEIIAGDKTSDIHSNIRQECEKFITPGMYWWALRCSDISALRDKLIEQNIPCSDIQDGSRIDTDGNEITWKLLFAESDLYGKAMPFFIQWGNHHPSNNQDCNTALKEVRISHPLASDLLELLLGIGLREDNVHFIEASEFSLSIDMERENNPPATF